MLCLLSIFPCGSFLFSLACATRSNAATRWCQLLLTHSVAPALFSSVPRHVGFRLSVLKVSQRGSDNPWFLCFRFRLWLVCRLFQDGWSLLHEAAKRNYCRAISLLVELGANPNEADAVSTHSESL